MRKTINLFIDVECESQGHAPDVAALKEWIRKHLHDLGEVKIDYENKTPSVVGSSRSMTVFFEGAVVKQRSGR